MAEGGRLPALATRVAFPNLRFDRPVALAYPADGSDLLFVVEQHQAKIWSFPDQPETSDKRPFLELPDPINRGNEEGLLGLAFHPELQGERPVLRLLFGQRPGEPALGGLAVPGREGRPAPGRPVERDADLGLRRGPVREPQRRQASPSAPTASSTSRSGDSGAADDPLSTGQNPSDWFGSILRIDVDHPAGGKPYGIPADNPARRSKAFSHWAPEVYCIGLRNVWKFSFDRETGEFWAGDVGQNLWEMVHRIENGGNYGWSIREGFHAVPAPAPAAARPGGEDPAADRRVPPRPDPRPQGHGLSITGGYVYRGKALPDLVGVYVYGDYETGRIWGLRCRTASSRPTAS